MRFALLVMLLLGATSGASAGFVGQTPWDPVEPVHWAAYAGENLAPDPRFERFGETWRASFVDVGGGEAAASDGVLTLLVPRAVLGGAAYADVSLPVRSGVRYHLAFEARLLGNASEVATLVVPQGGGEEILLRGEPRANWWGFGGEWTAPAGATEARIVLRFLIAEGESGGASFRALRLAEGAAPTPTAELREPPWLLPPGVHVVEADGERASLEVSEPPSPRVVGGRFVPRGGRANFTVVANDAARVELLPNTVFDPFRGWWAFDDGGTPATLRLARHDARIEIPSSAGRVQLSLAGVIDDPLGAGWRVRLDGSLPEGVRGQLFLRERDFPRTGGVQAEYVDGSRFVEGEGPWELHVERVHAFSRRLEVILALDVAPGPAREVALRSASLTVAGDLEAGVVLQGPIATARGLATLGGRSLDAFGRERGLRVDHWIGGPPQRCPGDEPSVAWVTPHDGRFLWRLPDGTTVPVDDAPRVTEGAAELVFANEVWWSSTDVESPQPSRARVERGSHVELELPCAVSVPPRAGGLRLRAVDGIVSVEAPWWRVPATVELTDADGELLAIIEVTEPPATVVGLVAAFGVAAWALAWWWRR